MSRTAWMLWVVAACVLTAAVACRPASASGPEGTQATGSAVVVTSEGHLLTCAHVVEDATAIHVRIQGVDHSAAVLAVEERTDLALLKIDATGLRAARLGGPQPPQPGQHVWAFGFPISHLIGGEAVKVTDGTVSAIYAAGTQQVVQTDASINPGNSGGPLVDDSGAVVGIVNAKIIRPDVSGVAFAVPVSYARSFLRREEVGFTEAAAPKPGGPGPEGTAPAPMDGPALVKAINPTVAFVSVDLGPSAKTGGTVALRTISVGDIWPGGFALSPGGRVLACSGGLTGTATVWDVATGEMLRTLSLPTTGVYMEARRKLEGLQPVVAGIAFSPNGAVLAGDSWPFAMVFWDAMTGEPSTFLPTGLLGSLFYACSPDGVWLIHGIFEGDEAEAVNLRTKKTRSLGKECTAVAISPDSNHAAIAYSARMVEDSDSPPLTPRVQIVDLATGKVERTLLPRTTGVHSVSFSPDGGYLAGTDKTMKYTGAPGERYNAQELLVGPGVVTIWDLRTGAVVRTLSQPGRSPSEVCFSPRGGILAVSFDTASQDEGAEAAAPPDVVLYDTRTWEPVSSLPGQLGGWSHTNAFSADGTLLATWDAYGKTVTVWKVVAR